MTKDKPIRYSTWHVEEKYKNKIVKHVVDEVLVAGEQKHVPVIARSEHYLARMYERLLKQAGRKVKRENLKVIMIKIHDQPDFGLGVGCLDKRLMEKLEL